MSKKDKAQPMSTSEAGRLGARKVNASKTPAERKAAARNAVKARWDKAKKAKK